MLKNNKSIDILSASAIISIINMDYIHLEEVEERMEHYDASENRTQEQMMQEFGITQSGLDTIDVELE